MRNRVTRVLAFLLFFFILANELNVFYSNENFDFANEYTKLPAGVLWKDKSGLRLNLTLYKEKGLIVYGDYTTIKNNDFKVVANGYYTKNSVKGEYRWHGYTVGGSMYSNTNFPDDVAMTRAENTYRYIPRIWEDTPTNKYYNANRLKYPSDVTRLATESGVDTIIQQYFQMRINATAPYSIVNPLYGDGKFYNYANVQTMPTWYNSGDFRMDHLVTYKDGRTELWYMDNSLARDKIEKKHKTVEAEFIGKPIFYSIENILKQGTVKVEIELKGSLDDKDLFDGEDKNIRETDELLRKHLYYNRQDIDHWELYVKDTITNKQQKIILNSKNVSVQSKFTIDLPYSDYSKLLTKDEKGNITTTKIRVDFEGIARVVYKQTKENGEHIYKEGRTTTWGNDETSEYTPPPIFIPQIPEPESGDESPIYPELEEPFYMLDTEKFKLYDRTDTTNVMDRWMLFDGEQLSDKDEEKMLNGEWLFPLTGEHEIHEYDIFWANDKGRTFHWRGFILVYSTKARVQVDVDGSYKENRLNTAYNNITSGNPKYVRDRSTYETLLFDIRGQEIYTGTKTDKKIDFISRLPYEDIEIDLQVECKVNPQYIERDDIPEGYHISNFYTYKMHVQEDHNPDIYCVVWNSVLTRNEELQMTLDIASYDGDIVSDNVATYKLYYDEDKDGVAEKLIKSGAVSDEIRKYKPDKLGMYEIVFYVKEEFGQTTLSQYITEADKKFTQIKRQFYVENLAPSTQIYTDIPANYPKVDLIFLNDENISRDYNQSIVESRISFTNDLIRESLNPYVYTWDLHTYVATQEATTTKETGTSYPPDSVPYSSGGYSGNLNRYDQVNNQIWEDHGSYVTETETVTVTGEQEGWSYIEYDPSGNIIDSDSTNQPTMDFGGGVVGNKDSWEETTDRDNATETLPNGNKKVKRTYKAKYSAQKQVKVKVWVPNEVLVDRWTGYYKGYIYKYVKQQFEATFRDTSNKYIIYMAKDKDINNIEDLHLVRQRASSKLILVGTSGIKSSIAHDFYIDSSLSLQDIYKEIANYISRDNPMERGSVVLIGEEFETSFADLDPEKDSLEKGGFQVVHEKNYFDNPMAQEANTNTAFVENIFDKQALPNKLSNAGKYIFHRRINDLPVGYPEKREYSNIANYVIYAHRKPIAMFGYKWEYNINTGYYDMEFEDRSYDLDLEFTDPLGKKGIRELKFVYYNKNDNIKYYSVPTRLLPGTYVINYYAKDNFGVWSDVYVRELVLPELPPPQVDAKLKTYSSAFSLNGIPASEDLFAYDIWTKYPYDVNVRLGLVSPFTSYRQLLSTNDLVRRDGQEMFWKDQIYNIPATVKNGTYTFNVRATDSLLSHRYTELPFNVMVKTPINLEPVLAEKVIAEKTYNIAATTSKYVNTAYSNSNVKVTMFYNTSYATTMTMNGNYTNWNKEYRPTKAIPEGMYMARFVATLPSGEFEEKILYYQYVYNTPPKINGGDLFEGSVNLNNNYVYENDNINFTLYYQDIDLTPVTVDIKLYDPDGKLLNHISKEINPVGNAYPPFDTKDYSEIYHEVIDKNGNKVEERFLFMGIKKTMSWDGVELKEKRISPQYKLVATVTDDYGETSTHELGFDVHDLWVNGAVTHTEKWEENRQKYNTKYPDKTRNENTYWSGEAFITNANTTEIDIASNIVCTKVSVEIINSNKPADKNYLSWLNPTNTKRNKWNLYYAKPEWDNKWGNAKPQKLILRFTAYFNNNWIETDDIEVIIDDQDSFWKLHREW